MPDAAAGDRMGDQEHWRGARVVLHADMDAFYAAVEQRERPELRGRPVIVGGSRDARGVVTAASYEARAFGVRSAMPLRTAARLCPQAEFVGGRFDLYAEVSERILTIFRSYTPLVEPLSLDEAFLDVTGCERRYGPPAAIAEDLRARVRRRERLPVSVGIATTKSVAKIASARAKPDGCLLVPPGQDSAFLAPLPVRCLWGVGPKTGELMKSRGVHTVGDLMRRDPQRFAAAMGAGAAKAARLAHAIDPRAVEPSRSRKSVGNEVTFDDDLSDRDLIVAYLQQLADHVGRRMREKRLLGRTVAVKLRYADFRTITRQTTLEPPVNSSADIFGAARRLFLSAARGEDIYRLVGVQVAGLLKGAYRQLPLGAPRERDRHALDTALDRIRTRFGDATVTAGSLLDSEARLSAQRYAWRDAVLG